MQTIYQSFAHSDTIPVQVVDTGGVEHVFLWLSGPMKPDTAKPPRMYVTGSLSHRLTISELKAYEDWFGLEPLTSRPLPQERAGLIVEKDGYRLYTPSQKPQPWHPGLAYKRIKLKEDALRKVMMLSPGDSVLDGTLGMGHDALALADAGATIRGVELNPGLLLYTLCGVARYSRILSRRIHGQCGDYRKVLCEMVAKAVDHVYLDPMFPKDSVSRSDGTWAVMRSVVSERDRLVAADLREALRVARKTVVFKLAPGELLTELPDGLRPEVVGSKRQRYAVWRSELYRE